MLSLSNLGPLIWANIWTIVLLALGAAAICRWGVRRPVTRHTVWVVVLVWVLVLPLLPMAPSAGVIDGLVAASDPRPDAGSNDQAAPETEVESHPPLSTPRIVTRKPEQAVESDNVVPSRPAPKRTPRPTLRKPERPVAKDGATAPAAPLDKTNSVGKRTAIANRCDPEEADSAAALTQATPTAIPPKHPSPATPTPTYEPPVVAGSTDAAESSENCRRTNVAAMKSEPWTATGRAWLATLVGLRDVLRSIPPIPASVWLAGSGLVVLSYLLGAVWFYTRVRRGPAPPRWVTRETKLIARRLRLRRAPEIIMVQNQISPMVWCGARPRLLLPMKLWSELDRPGRRAILCHELAHLRRYDHWVRWIELAAGALYWWHPIIWWVRRRIHDEADSCCDAWVTWLMPRGRRAYAEALLKTKSFVDSDAPTVCAAPAMGVVTRSGARRLARRITMVMTQSNRPRHSVTGVAFASTLVLAAWVLAPMFAGTTAANAAPVDTASFDSAGVANDNCDETPRATCSTKKRDNQCKKTCEKKCEHKCPPKCKEPAAPQRVTPLATAIATPAPRVHAVFSDAAPLPSPPRVPRALTYGGTSVPAPLVFVGDDDADAGSHRVLLSTLGKEERVYRLSEGKLDALTGIMVRDDVPILVEPVPGGLKVYATPDQHAAFKAFVLLIRDDREGWTEYELPEGKLDAVSDLMIRSDVPVYVRTDDDGISVQGNAAVQYVFRNFVELIHPSKSERKIAGLSSRYEAFTGGRGFASGWRPQEMEVVRESLAQAVRARQERRAAGIEQLQRQIEALEVQMHALEEQAEELRVEADEIGEHAEDADHPDGQRALERQMRMLERRVRKFERQAERISRQAERLQEEGERLESSHERGADRMDRMEELLDMLEDLLDEEALSDVPGASAGLDTALAAAGYVAEARALSELWRAPDAPAAGIVSTEAIEAYAQALSEAHVAEEQASDRRAEAALGYSRPPRETPPRPDRPEER